MLFVKCVIEGKDSLLQGDVLVDVGGVGSCGAGNGNEGRCSGVVTIDDLLDEGEDGGEEELNDKSE